MKWLLSLYVAAIGVHFANAQTVPSDDWKAQAALMDLMPRCKAAPPAAGHMIGARPDPCINQTETGAYFVSASKNYSLRCGPYNCGEMVRSYLKTKRVPSPVE